MKVKLLITNLNSKEGELEKIIPPELEILTIGRHPSSYVYLNAAHISKEHALIIHEYDTFFLVDKSTNGTLLNQVRVEREKRNRLNNGDVIVVGEYRMIFVIEQEQPRAQAVRAGMPEVAAPPVQPPPQIVPSAFDVYGQEPDPSVDAADTLFAPTRFEDVIRNLEPGEEASYLVFVGGARDGQRIEMRGSTSEIYIGRAPNCQVQISHQSIAPMHAKIRMDWAGITVYDLSNQNGVFINGVRINSSRKLHNGDEISFGVPVSSGGVKLILYDRNSLSGENWVGLPPPITVQNPEKAPEKAPGPEAAEPKPEPAAGAAPAGAAPAGAPAEAAAAQPAAQGYEELTEAAEQKLSLKSIRDLNSVVFAGITVRELIIIVVLVIVVLIFSAIAFSFLGL